MILPSSSQPSMPKPVWFSLVLLFASLLPGWLATVSGTAATVRLATSLLILALAAGVMLRFRAVRLILAVLLAAGLASLVSTIAAGRTTPPLVLAITLAQLVATALLFTPAATRWFRSRPKRRGK